MDKCFYCNDEGTIPSTDGPTMCKNCEIGQAMSRGYDMGVKVTFDQLKKENKRVLTENDRLRETLKSIGKYAREQRNLVCGYMDGETLCDCKYLNGHPIGEQTGCCEFRHIWIEADEALKG